MITLALARWRRTSTGARMAAGRRVGIAVRLGSALGAVLLGGALLRAQPPAPTMIDVTVVDAKGEPAPALTADRFRVQVGGRTQTVTRAELVRADVAAGRSLMLVVDQSSVAAGAEGPLVEVARAFVRRLAPGDRVGVTALPAPGPRVALTTDHGAVIEAIGAIKGRRSLDVMDSRIGLGEALAIARGDALALGVVSSRECQGIGDTQTAWRPGLEQNVYDQGTNDCFKRITRSVDRLVANGTREAAAIVPGMVSALGDLTGASGARALVLVTSGLSTGRKEPALPDLVARASEARATVDALLVDPATQNRAVPINRQTDRRGLAERLNELTISTRGHVEAATPQSADAFDALLRETAGYYQLAVTLDPKAAGPVRVDVRGAKLTVRTRPFLVDATGSSVATGPMSRDDRMAEALGAGGVRTSELPVRAAAIVNLGTDRTAGLVITGEVDAAAENGPPPPPSDQAGAGRRELSLSYALFDARQQPVAAGALPRIAQGAREGSQAFVGRLGGLPPGRYTLRLAAIDGAGRMGSVERDVDVRVTEASGLTAGHVAVARVTRGQIDALPSVDEIAQDAAILLQVDVAGDAAVRRALGGAFLVRPRGSAVALLTRRAELVPDDTAGLARLVTTIEGGLLSPGDYEVVAALEAPGGVALTTAPRSLTLSPRAGGAASMELTRGAWLAALTPKFARTRVLEADVLKPVIARLEARATAPAVRTALAHALDGRPDALVVDAAVRRADPVAGAFLTGVSLFARGDLEAAALQFREALRSDAEFTPAMFYLGACYAAGGRDREAAGAWQTAMIDEAAGVVPALLADAWLRAGDADAALDIVDEALAQAPADPALVERRITALLTLARPADALTALDAAPSMSPDLLFAAMRVLVDAHTARQPVVSPDADRQRLQTYAERYKAANGPQQPLVESWIAAWR